MSPLSWPAMAAMAEGEREKRENCASREIRRTRSSAPDQIFVSMLCVQYRTLADMQGAVSVSVREDLENEIYAL